MQTSDQVSARRKLYLILALVLVLIIGVVARNTLLKDDIAQTDMTSQDVTTGQAIDEVSDATPKLQSDVLVSGRSYVWDIAFLPSSEMLFSERTGAVSVMKAGKVSQVATISDVKARGEGGLMGLAVDPQFDQNRFVYACLNSTAGDIRVTRWKLAANLDGLQDRKDIIAGITANPSGRHSGCRMAFEPNTGKEAILWIGTGDSATGTQPQDPKSLNGKVLRVDREGKAIAGNLGGSFDSRIYSYGHRNTQGIAFFETPKRFADGSEVVGLSAEHGSDVDDEVNELRKGNFGWAPPAGYSEAGVSMTDTKRFRDAIGAVWSSSRPTTAPSGMAIINGKQWQGWDGAAAVAMLKDKYLQILRLDAGNQVVKEEKAIEGEFGRLRTAVQGPDGNLYVATDNGKDDKIIRITPR